jgi:hypothetical protein
LEWFYEKDDHTTTTTTTTTTTIITNITTITNTTNTTITSTSTTTKPTANNNNNKINNTVHPMRYRALAEGKRMYSFNTLSTTAHIGVGNQHEAPAVLPLVKIGTDFIKRIRGLRGRCGKARKISPNVF